MTTSSEAAVVLTETVDLDVGIVVDGVCHQRAVLRVARLSDVYAGAAAVAVPDGVKESDSARVAYQMAVDDGQILAQVVELGSLYPAPAIEVLMARIDPDDMELLRKGAVRLKKKLLQLRSNSPTTAEPNTSSCEPASG